MPPFNNTSDYLKIPSVVVEKLDVALALQRKNKSWRVFLQLENNNKQLYFIPVLEPGIFFDLDEMQSIFGGFQPKTFEAKFRREKCEILCMVANDRRVKTSKNPHYYKGFGGI